MTADEYMASIKRTEQTIMVKKLHLETALENAGVKASNLTGMPRGDSGAHSSMEEALCRAVQLEEEIVEAGELLRKKKNYLQRKIESVPDPMQQAVLLLHYLRSFSLRQMEKKIGINRTGCNALLTEGTKVLDYLLKIAEDIP